MTRLMLDQLPNLFILGAAKAGTSSLYEYLAQHPSIFAPTEKEPHFFDNDEAYARGLEWYVDTYFPNAAGYPWRMDGSPVLGQSHVVIPRLERTYRDKSPKFIIILREPVSRAWSHYLHRVSLGWEPLSFEAALAAEPQRAAQRRAWDQYFNNGLYTRVLRTWFEHFPRQDFHILLTDDLRAHPLDAVRKIFAFLQIEQDVAITASRVHNRAAVNSRMGLMLSRLKVPRFVSNAMSSRFGVRPRVILRNFIRRLPGESLSPPEHVVEQLRSAYRQDILDLSELIGRDLSGWLKPAEKVSHRSTVRPARSRAKEA